MKRVFILIGAPGSGKGTQSKFLTNHFGIAHISTGDMLRKEIELNTDLGKEIKGVLSSGNLIDDVLMTDLLEIRINQSDCEKGFVLDGYPRTIEQASMLTNLFNKYGISYYKVIEISVDEDILVKRITGRYSCHECGFIYNDFFINPKINGVCDKCGSSNFDRRSDDNLNSLKKRLELYHNQSTPILLYYKNIGCCYIVDGNLDSDDSNQKLIKVLI